MKIPYHTDKQNGYNSNTDVSELNTKYSLRSNTADKHFKRHDFKEQYQNKRKLSESIGKKAIVSENINPEHIVRFDSRKACYI